MKDKISQLKAGALLSYAQMGLGVIIQLFYTPIMLRILGANEYGLYNTVSSTITMLSVLSLGFNSSYIRYYAKYKKDNDEDSIKKLNGLFLIIFLIIGFVALICGLFLSFNLELVFDKGLTAAEYKTARILMLLLTVNLSVSFPMSVFQSIISAHERYVFLKLLGMLKNVVGPLVTLPLLLLGFRSISMVVVTLAIAVITDVIYLIYSRKKLNVGFVFHDFEKGIFKSLFAFTFFIALNSVVDQINSNMGKFLLGRYKGTEVVAVYSVGYTIYQLYMTFSTAISGVFSPRIHKIVNETFENISEQKSRLTELFVKVGRIQFLILSLVCTGLIFFGKPFISIWAGEGYGESYYVMLLLCISTTVPLIQNIGIEIQRAQNKHQFRSYVYLGMAAINLISTVFLSQLYGAVGAAIGTAVSLIVANGVIMNIFYHKKCNIDVLNFWKSILRQSLGLIIPVICGILMNHFFDFDSIIRLLLGATIYTCVYCLSMWIFGMNQYERALMLKLARKIIKR